jgi:hypothetical protein
MAMDEIIIKLKKKNSLSAVHKKVRTSAYEFINFVTD